MNALVKVLPSPDLKSSGRKSLQALTSLIISARRLSSRKHSATSARHVKRFNPRRAWRLAIVAVRFALRAKRLCGGVKLTQQEREEIISKFYAAEAILDVAGVRDFIAQFGQQISEEELEQFLRWTLYKPGHALTLRQLVSLMTHLKRKHVSSAVVDTREAFEALATDNGKIPAGTLQRTIKQFDLNVRIDAVDSDDSAAGGEALLSYDDFSRLLVQSEHRMSIRQVSASFRSKLQNTASEKLLDSAVNSALPTGIPKNDTPHEQHPTDFLSSEMPDIFAMESRSKKSSCTREVFPLRAKSGKHYTFDEVVARIDDYNSQIRPSREKLDSRVRYCTVDNRPASCSAFISSANAHSTKKQPRCGSAAFAAPIPRIEPPPPPMSKRGRYQETRFPSLEEKRKELMRSIPRKSIDDFVQSSKCFLRPEEKGEVMMKHFSSAGKHSAVQSTEAPLIRERARTALAHLFPGQ